MNGSTLEISLLERIQGCWLGKSIGGTLGLPAEGKMERLDFSFYDPIPTIAPPNDDLELQLVWLHMVEQAGNNLAREDFAKAWLDHIHYMWDEYGVCRWNLRRGVPASMAGVFENHFQSGMGSPIRSELWACLFPEDPDSSAYYASLDASLDHGVEGIAGEVFFSVLQNFVIAERSLEESITLALRYIPDTCETARAVSFVVQSYADSLSEWGCWEQLLAKHGHENFTHAPVNVALTIWALLYGESDFERSILLAANAGHDTDCTAATVGATLGLLLGVNGIPERWIQPIGEGVFIGPGIIGIEAPQTLAELTQRTIAAIGKLRPQKWNASIWIQLPESFPDLVTLPGTISLQLLGSEKMVPWANGELPQEVKQAGGATWSWHRITDEPRDIICLAREGAKLFIDDELFLECPRDLPYVPATHRSAPGSRLTVRIAPGAHTVRLELNSRSADQEASVILAYPNLHIAPWTARELPYPADLPSA